MWTKSHSKTYKNVDKADIWKIWADIPNWPQWDNDLDYCQIDGDFREGNQFILKPKSGPKVKIHLSHVSENQGFTDYCKFPGAKMYDIHTLEDTGEGLKITTTITVKGPLTFLWSRLVAKDVAAGLSAQTDNLVERARGLA